MDVMRLASPLGDALVGFTQGAGQVFLVFGAVFALLNCFLGYKLVRLWSALAGFAIGWILVFAVTMRFWDNPGLCAVLGIVGGVALGAAAYFIYKAGVFLFCFFLAVFFCAAFVPGWPGVAAGVVVGLVVGILAMKFMREVLILTSAWSGGMNAANSLLPVFGCSWVPAVWIVGVALAAAGIFVQWKATGGRKTEL